MSTKHSEKGFALETVLFSIIFRKMVLLLKGHRQLVLAGIFKGYRIRKKGPQEWPGRVWPYAVLCDQVWIGLLSLCVCVELVHSEPAPT